MPENLEINSFDELKAALDEALHNGGTSSDVADYLMERFDVLCADIDNVFLSRLRRRAWTTSPKRMARTAGAV